MGCRDDLPLAEVAEIAERVKAGVVLFGSGSIRSGALGPAITLGTIPACHPYDDGVSRFTVTGAALRRG